MAYISTEEVKVKREKLKVEFPSSKGWKFSVKREHHSSISVNILTSPFNLGKYEQVNEYHIHNHYADREGVKNALLKIKDIINEGNFDKSDYYSDYVHVGFYINISIGKYDKHHVWIKQSIKGKV